MTIDAAPVLRHARQADVEAVVALVNDAYEVEAFFVEGDRTGRAEVAALIDRGECFVADAAGRIVGCVEVAIRDGRGYFGMLAVAVESQRRGVGRRLIALAEDHARGAGCAAMDIKVVNLRPDLLAFYGALGYEVTGTAPYEHRVVRQPCHFVLMTKVLD